MLCRQSWINTDSHSFQVAIGGGSAIGLAKALALHTNGSIKQIAIPTT